MSIRVPNSVLMHFEDEYFLSNTLFSKLSRLRLPEPAQLAKGKNLVEPAMVSDDDESNDETLCREQEFPRC